MTVGPSLNIAFWLKADLQPHENEVCFYEALVVKVVVVCVA